MGTSNSYGVILSSNFDQECISLVGHTEQTTIRSFIKLDSQGFVASDTKVHISFSTGQSASMPWFELVSAN